MIRLENFSTGYGKKRILENINLEFPDGQLCAVAGQNGSGKSTLLKGICGLLGYEGSCRLDNAELSGMNELGRARKAGYLSDSGENGLPVTVTDMVMLGWYPNLSGLKRPDNTMREKTLELLKTFGLEEYRDTEFGALSTGRQRLVLAARTLVREPSHLLLDEPDGPLDYINRHLLMKFLKEYAGRGRNVLVCSHDINLLLKFADRIILLKDGRVTAELCLTEKGGKISAQEEICRNLQEVYGCAGLIIHEGKYVMI